MGSFRHRQSADFVYDKATSAEGKTKCMPLMGNMSDLYHHINYTLAKRETHAVI